MQLRISFTAFLMLAALGLAGCSKTSETPNASADTTAGTTNDEGPAKMVAQFLEAVRTGDDDKARQLLSTVAQQKTAEMNCSVTPPASDTARFEVGQVELVGNDGARVTCKWTDLDENGKPHTDNAIWVVRHEASGWRIAGVAATVFDGEPPLLLNFEDPQEMKKKQEWLRDEIARRSQPEAPQAQRGTNPPDSFRR